MARFIRRRRPASESAARRPTTEEILADLRDPLPPGRLEWGLPTRCPRCEDWGYIDRLDLVDHVMQLHCPTCHFRWEITEAQIEASQTLDEQQGATEQRTVDDREAAADPIGS